MDPGMTGWSWPQERGLWPSHRLVPAAGGTEAPVSQPRCLMDDCPPLTLRPFALGRSQIYSRDILGAVPSQRLQGARHHPVQHQRLGPGCLRLDHGPTARSAPLLGADPRFAFVMSKS